MIVIEKKVKSLFSVYDLGVKLLTRLRLQFSHLNKDKFRYGFGDTVSSMCGCNAEIENIEHILLCCHFHSAQRFKLFNNINKGGTKEQVNILFYGYTTNKSNTLNQDIIKFVINFLKKSSRFYKLLRPLLCQSVFSIISFSCIAMRNVDII